ncbi:MAG: YqaA family protein [Putridiphycobacter sp.]|nr:YqaA family protein [Putridiphycobacter sp.]
MLLASLGYIGLFIGTFISATIFPTPSEAFVIGAYELEFNVYIVLIVASIGNLLGGLTNYYIGYKVNSEGLKKRFKLNQERIDRWEVKLNKYGYWLGLISWLPVIGDPMVGVLGFFKVKFWPLTLTMFIGKCGRYLILTFLYFEIF